MEVLCVEVRRFLAIATVIIDSSCGILKMLLVPLPTTLGALLGVLHGDVR
jgi:hypothetical protein